MDDCVHHWLLPTPAGSTVIGRCKKCEVEQEFLTSNEKFFGASRIQHSMSISSGIREVLGPQRVEEAYKE